MDLSEMLALLPDNTTGDIGADDLRSIVTELWNQARTYGNLYAYKWDNTPASPPASGQITMDQPWALTATQILISESTDDGLTLTFALVDDALSGRIWLSTSGGARLEADVLGPTVDQGTYREIPIQVTSVTGSAPGNNAPVTLTIIVQAG
jgi:hypothetical protein